ncbi:P-loop containing nucleoside triphosphate hydrolase protein [Exidia glandulosa HHB12029]|uniref:p-loop containing nucleoside triphosphate hydrolase protein n=1 Tax=Exidia glandulosa HHB12029 TaxID=1314781 RepID=A0A165PHN6_EXIGL|nr:P-loop containing nucleoside triphosphate hydrolase protein [Exidia glandulosa HHB12029]
MPIAAVAVLGQKRCLSELGRLLHTSARLSAKSALKTTPPRDHHFANTMDSKRGKKPAARKQQQHQHQHAPKSRPKPAVRGPPVVEGPVLNEEGILAAHGLDRSAVPKAFFGSGKELIRTHCKAVSRVLPPYESTKIIIDGTTYFRATIRFDDITAHGDAVTRRESERLALVDLLCHLEVRGELAKTTAQETVDVITFDDGSVVDYDIAKQFMDYYCVRFGFQPPAIAFEGKNRSWDASLSVGGRRIGLGTGANKRVAMCNAYLDVTKYLYSCDNALWAAFKEAARTGKDLGLAPKVNLILSDDLGESMRDLNRFLHNSELYRKRPGATASDSSQQSTPASLQRRWQPDAQFLADKSARLKAEREEYKKKPSLEKIRNQRESLPVFTQAAELLQTIEANEVTICMAATGSGKTTQIPQIILDDWIAKDKGTKCNILCTQPRRLAAISVAERVASERGEPCGKSVGYQVRFENKQPEMHGCITFCTTGIFLRRMQSSLVDPQSQRNASMDDVTHIVVDEAHERDVDTDLTLMVLRRLLVDRRARGIPLKVILMSATIDPTMFQEYFATQAGKPAPLISIPGRSFPVQKHFLDEYLGELREFSGPSHWVWRDDFVTKFLNREIGMGKWGSAPPLSRAGSSYRSISSAQSSPRLAGVDPDVAQKRDDDVEIPYALIALTIARVLAKSSDGHVLVFMPGWEEIMSVQRILEDAARPLPGLDIRDKSKYEVLILHSSVPVAEQNRVFEPPSPGVRRVILATNVAETSVTIPDVVYVVDSGRVKELRFEPERHMSSLISAWVGGSNLNQRAGRAGRHRPGDYYGVLTKERADKLNPYQTVEMLRTDLSNVVMHVKALNFSDLEVEDVLAQTIEPPDPDRVELAMSHLKMVGALDAEKNLTALGRVLLQLPIEAQVGRLLLFGAFFRCLDRALTLAAILTNRDPFLSPALQKKEAQARKQSWATQEFKSDPLTVLRAFETWHTYHSRGEWNAANQFAFDNFLSKPTLLVIQKIKTHLLQNLYTTGIIDVAMGRTDAAAPMPHGMRRSEQVVPTQLNQNGDSMPLLALLITVASQPKFAVRTGSRMWRTQREKGALVHPASVNGFTSRDSRDEESWRPEIIAYNEKRQNLTMGQDKPQMYLMTTTRIDPLIYTLFGAFEVKPGEGNLECDEWVPIGGYVPYLQEVGRLKYLMESCFLRVYDGIVQGRLKRQQQSYGSHMARRDEEEHEWDEEDDVKRGPLADKEINELGIFSRELVRVLDRFNEDRVASSAPGSRRGSRPSTPSGSGPGDSSFGRGGDRLQVPSRSGYSTPRGVGGLRDRGSRPGTPSRLSRPPSPMENRLRF